MSKAYLGIDLGASSGRAILGVLSKLAGGPPRLQLEEVHRFEHQMCPTPSGPVWNLTGIWLDVLEGMRRAQRWCADEECELISVGVDAWGVDWSVVGASGELLALPHCYRDPQNEVACQSVLKQISKAELYEQTGIQLMPINSIFQVVARNQAEPALMRAAQRLLFIPDLIHYWLSGEMMNERTVASTSGLLSVETGDWDFELMQKLGLPEHLFGDLIEPGTIVGSVSEAVAHATGVSPSLKVVAPGSHDTASAVAAVPVSGDPDKRNRGDGDKKRESKASIIEPAATGREQLWAYLSSGTWSLLGIESMSRCATPAARDIPFTNELGLEGTTRFLKNIAGLWLVQELRRERQTLGEEVSFAELTQQAAAAEPCRTLIDPNAAQFAAPGNFAAKIREFARVTDQPEPETLGDLVRCCLDSLALCYLQTIKSLERVRNVEITRLHIVGGGIKNRLLSKITAAAIQRPVICGPVEATAVGNVLVQAIGCGELAGLTELREVVANSFSPEEIRIDLETASDKFGFGPEVYPRYLGLLGQR